MNDTLALLSHLSSLVEAKEVVKISLSKVRDKAAAVRNVYIRPIVIKGDYVYQVSKRTKTQDFVENIPSERLEAYVEASLSNDFFNAHIQATTADYSLLQNKKGNAKLTIKKGARKEANLEHNHSKKKYVDTSALYLERLGITTQNGQIRGSHQKKFKQINRYIELLDGLVRDSQLSTIVDMGSGKGYLTFALYDYLRNASKDISIRGVESRPELVTLCNTIAQESKYAGLRFQEGNIGSVDLGKVDMVIALHACDIATDMAIAKGIEAQAQYIVVAPCCHKQIRKAMDVGNSIMSPVLQHGILLERQAEMITDGIRALILEAQGYRTKVFEFISSEHTGKNVMITAAYTGVKDAKALDQIRAIKQEYGIAEHYLETMLKQ